MRRLAFLAAAAGLTMATLASASEPDAVLIEEAWLIPSTEPETASLYLVINNRSAGDVVLQSVSTSAARSARLLRPSGDELTGGALVPPHSELYMQLGGVYVALAGTGRLVAGQTVPVAVELDTGISAQVDATVLAAGAGTPDHHSYKH